MKQIEGRTILSDTAGNCFGLRTYSDFPTFTMSIVEAVVVNIGIRETNPTMNQKFFAVFDRTVGSEVLLLPNGNYNPVDPDNFTRIDLPEAKKFRNFQELDGAPVSTVCCVQDAMVTQVNESTVKVQGEVKRIQTITARFTAGVAVNEFQVTLWNTQLWNIAQPGMVCRFDFFTVKLYQNKKSLQSLQISTISTNGAKIAKSPAKQMTNDVPFDFGTTAKLLDFGEELVERASQRHRTEAPCTPQKSSETSQHTDDAEKQNE